MRLISLLIVIVFVAVLSVFAIENLDETTVSLFGWSLTAPRAAIIVSVYLLGMITGGSVVSFLMRSLHGATEPSRRGAKAPARG